MKKNRIVIPAALTLLALSSCASAVKKTLTVSFDSDGGTPIIEQKITYGETAKRPTQDPVKEGYTFVNWYHSKDASSAIFDFDTEKITKDIVIYAHYTTQICTVTFDTQGGSAIEPQKIEYGQTASRPSIDPTITGGLFEGWYTDTTYQTKFDFGTRIVSDTTVYAKWKKEKYSVTFINDPTYTETQTPSQIVPYGDLAEIPEDPEPLYPETFVFAGWYDNEKCEGTSFDFSTPIVKTTVLYSKWVAEQWVVAFHYDGAHGQEYVRYTAVKKDTPVSRPTDPYWEGYAITGWYTDEEFKGEPYDFSKNVTGHLELFAKWEVVKCTVTFELNGGTSESPTTVVVQYGILLERPKDPTKDSAPSTFVNWFTDAECNNPFNFEETKIESDITLYAGWGYTVKFDCSTYSKSTFNPQKVVASHHASFPGFPVLEDPSKNCYGWGDFQSNPFDFEKDAVTQDITLYPLITDKWIEIKGERNIDINNTSGYSYEGSVPGFSWKGWDWSVVSGYESILTCRDGKFYPTSGTKGGTAYIAGSGEYAGSQYYGILEVEVSSLSKLDLDSLAKGTAKAKNIYISGNLVIPSYYFVSTGENEGYWQEITSVAKQGFYECSGLNGYVKIPYTLRTIGEQAFRCFNRNPGDYSASGNITSVIYEDDGRLESIGAEAFDGQKKLSSITIPASVLEIGAGAFYESLTTAYFQDQSNKWYLKQIPDFGTEVVEGWNPTAHLPEEAAIHLKNLSSQNPRGYSDFTWTKIYTEQGLKYTYDAENNVLLVSVNPESKASLPSTIIIPETYSDTQGHVASVHLANQAFMDCENVEFVSLPKSVTHIPSEAFRGCGVNKSNFFVSMKDTVTGIGPDAFHGCTTLKSINLPVGLLSISSYAFKDCINLSYVDLYSNTALTTIGMGAFMNCGKLEMITIPETTMEVEAKAFIGCNNLIYAYFADSKGWKNVSENQISTPIKAAEFLKNNTDTRIYKE